MKKRLAAVVAAALYLCSCSGAPSAPSAVPDRRCLAVPDLVRDVRGSPGWCGRHRDVRLSGKRAHRAAARCDGRDRLHDGRQCVSVRKLRAVPGLLQPFLGPPSRPHQAHAGKPRLRDGERRGVLRLLRIERRTGRARLLQLYGRRVARRRAEQRDRCPRRIAAGAVAAGRPHGQSVVVCRGHVASPALQLRSERRQQGPAGYLADAPGVQRRYRAQRPRSFLRTLRPDGRQRQGRAHPRHPPVHHRHRRPGHELDARPAREQRNPVGGDLGVLSLTLLPNTYRWEFVPVAGATFRDAGPATCH